MPAPITVVHTGETYQEKALRKFKEQPLVPIGVAATTAALVMAMVKMRRGESQSLNNWLRVRVVAQSLTIVAVCAGTWAFGREREADSTNPRMVDDIQAKKEEKESRDRKEFEGRLKEAEQVWTETQLKPKDLKIVPADGEQPGTVKAIPTKNAPAAQGVAVPTSSSSWWRWW